MKVLLVSVLLLGVCGLTLSAVCKRNRVTRIFPRHRNPNEGAVYAIRVQPSEIDSTLTVKVDNAGESSIVDLLRKPRLSVTGVDKEEGIFSLALTAYGKQKLEKRVARYEAKLKENPKLRWKPTLWTGIEIKFSKTIDPKAPNAPRLAEYSNGTFSCSGPQCALKDPCSTYFEKSGETSDSGTANLPITTGRHWELKVGFDRPVVELKLKGRLHYEDNECNQTWRFHDRHKWWDSGRDLLLSKWSIRVQAQEAIPPVSYIEYEDRACKTSCGTKPVCPTTTTAAPETEEPTEEATEEPTEEATEEPTEEETGPEELDESPAPADEEDMFDVLEDELDGFF